MPRSLGGSRRRRVVGRWRKRFFEQLFEQLLAGLEDRQRAGVEFDPVMHRTTCRFVLVDEAAERFVFADVPPPERLAQESRDFWGEGDGLASRDRP